MIPYADALKLLEAVFGGLRDDPSSIRDCVVLDRALASTADRLTTEAFAALARYVAGEDFEVPLSPAKVLVGPAVTAAPNYVGGQLTDDWHAGFFPGANQ